MEVKERKVKERENIYIKVRSSSSNNKIIKILEFLWKSVLSSKRM